MFEYLINRLSDHEDRTKGHTNRHISGTMNSQDRPRLLRLCRGNAIIISVVLAVAGAMAAPRAYGADFALNVSPASAVISAGSSARFTLTATSKGLTGSINVGIISVTPQVSNGPSFSLSRYDIWISPTAPNGTARIDASTTGSTPAGTYTITVRGRDISGGAGHGTAHTTTFSLTVK
jgi:hypothetical protein